MDGVSRRMLEYLTDETKVPQGHASYQQFIEDYSEHSGLPEYKVQACLRFLAQEGFIGPAGSGRPSHFQVEHKSYHQFYFLWRTVRAYIADKWVDFFALTVAVVALLRTF